MAWYTNMQPSSGKQWGVQFDVDEFHPVTHVGAMLARYDARLKAAFCKFCNSARW